MDLLAWQAWQLIQPQSRHNRANSVCSSGISRVQYSNMCSCSWLCCDAQDHGFRKGSYGLHGSCASHETSRYKRRSSRLSRLFVEQACRIRNRQCSLHRWGLHSPVVETDIIHQRVIQFWLLYFPPLFLMRTATTLYSGHMVSLSQTSDVRLLTMLSGKWKVVLNIPFLTAVDIWTLISVFPRGDSTQAISPLLSECSLASSGCIRSTSSVISCSLGVRRVIAPLL